MNKLIITAIIIFAAFTRLIPHPPNFTPIIAMGLFGGAYLKDRRLVFLIPLIAMIIADAFLGFHGTMIWVYGSLIIISMMGILLKNRTTLKNCAVATLGGSLLFFLVTNFGVWIIGGFYEKSIGGLFKCYTMALPFFHNTLAGSVVYSAIIFGGYEGLKNYLPERVPNSPRK